jgi:hypothetical protein
MAERPGHPKDIDLPILLTIRSSIHFFYDSSDGQSGNLDENLHLHRKLWVQLKQISRKYVIIIIFLSMLGSTIELTLELFLGMRGSSMILNPRPWRVHFIQLLRT